MRRLSLLVVLLALPAMGQGILYGAGGGQCGVNMTCTAERFVATAGSGDGFACDSQLGSCFDVGGACGQIGRDGSGFIQIGDGCSPVVDVGDTTRIQSGQMILTNGGLFLDGTTYIQNQSGPVRIDDTARYVPRVLDTCVAGLEFSLATDVASGASTGARSRICLCTSDGAAAYAWQNIVTANVGNATTCPP
jgi:hypothetical protein